MLKKNLMLLSALLMLTAGFALLISQSALAETPPEDLNAQNTIQEIDFWVDQDKTLHVQLLGQGPFSHTVTDREQDRMHILLPESRAAEKLVRLYRLNEMDTSLKSLLLRNTDEGALLTWVWSSEPDFSVQEAEDELLFQIAPGSDAPGAAPAGAGLATLEQEAGELMQDSLFPGMREEYTGEPVSIDLQNAEVEHVLRLITHHTEYNLILDEEVQGKISLRLREVPWDQALDLVLAQKDLGMVRKGNIIRVTTADRLEAEEERRRRSRQAELEDQESLRKLEPLQQRFIQINYARADELQPRIEDFLSERGRVTQDARTNTLIVRDTPSQLEEITQLIDNLDRPERQVLIEARVVYATESFRRELGVDWGFAYQSPGLDSNIISPDTFNFPSDLEGLLGVGYMGHEGQSFSVLEARLRLGESQGKSNTISAPQIMTLNNQEAKIEQGTDVAVDVIDADLRTRREYVPATLELIVTPQITPDNNLILNLEVSDNAPGEGGNIEVKKAETTLFAEDGETIVIGGIKKLSESQRETGIPPLSRLPILGWLFKHELVEENMDELLIFIRPKIQ